MGSFFRGLAIERRVLAALFMREIQTRWGRRNLGFAWVFAEPLVFAFPVLTMWSYVRAPIDRGLPMIAFVWCGYLPLLIFRHVTGRSLYVVRSNSALLYHRAVTPLDLLLALCGLEALGGIAASVVSFVVFHMLGMINLPENPPQFFAGFLFMTWWAFSVALIVAALSERSDLVEHIWVPFAYMYMMFSGFPFLSDWLPPSLRSLALAIDPPLHAYDMIRGGLFGHLIRTHEDPVYLAYFLAVLTLIGLWLMRHVRHHVEIL